jgi:hypothetical protein
MSRSRDAAAVGVAAAGLVLSVPVHEYVHTLQVQQMGGGVQHPKYLGDCPPGLLGCVIADQPRDYDQGWWSGEGPAYLVQGLFLALSMAAAYAVATGGKRKEAA